jgi:hypothetical protein
MSSDRDSERPTAPLTEAARRGGGGHGGWRPAGARETPGPVPEDPDPATARGRATAREPATARRDRPRASAGEHPTSSFDRFVLWTISATRRLVRSWRALSSKRRLAAYAALGLFVGLFLPWYSQTVVATGRRASVQPTSVSLTGWGAFSLVQTVVLLVSIGVLVLMFQRGEGRTFRLPGGDGATILVAGSLTCVLLLWAIFDRPGANGPGQYTTATGVEWGIFIVLALAALLAYAGSQLRAAYLNEARTRAAEPAPATSARTTAARHQAAPDDDATRVSNRRPYDQPTPVSTRRAPVDTPTKVSTRRPAPASTPTPAPAPPPASAPTPAEEPTSRIGPPVVPEDPPTMPITRRRPAEPADPQDG